jgi:hypothetical protein
MFHLLAYSFSTVGTFAIVSLIRNADGVEDANLSHRAALAGSAQLLRRGCRGVGMPRARVTPHVVLPAPLGNWLIKPS